MIEPRKSLSNRTHKTAIAIRDFQSLHLVDKPLSDEDAEVESM